MSSTDQPSFPNSQGTSPYNIPSNAIADHANAQGSPNSLSSPGTPGRGGSQESGLQGKNNHAVQLIEDNFGVYIDEVGKPNPVKRFTWKNHNRIEVQVINYGARIISMRYPDRKGMIDDVVLGYDDFPSYQHSHINFGGTIGRVTGVIEGSTFLLNKKYYDLRPNFNVHHRDGGLNGFDRRLWKTHVAGKKVVMSLSSDDSFEGYPGILLVHITFELSPVNEFKITMQAQTSEPTIINLSNLTYLNLAGHHAGPQEIYKHMLTLNCNCFTKEQDGLPTGEIMNVVHTKHDFQVPKVLGKVINCNPKEGIDQNFCVNRGIDQEDAFVARLLHPRTGRMLEVYSNQPGIRIETANDWGTGIVRSNSLGSSQKTPEPLSVSDKYLQMAQVLHEAVMTDLHIDCQNEYLQIRDLLTKVGSMIRSYVVPDDPNVSAISMSPNVNPAHDKSQELSVPFASSPENEQDTLTPVQENYLQKMLYHCNQHQTQDFSDIADVIRKILVSCLVLRSEMISEIPAADHNASNKEMTEGDIQERDKEIYKEHKVPPSSTSGACPFKIYKDGRVHGKGNAIYQMNSGIALQTQNYPNAINQKDFPNCVLNPMETYKHIIKYKFWIRAGQPAKWLRRNRDV